MGGQPSWRTRLELLLESYAKECCDLGPTCASRPRPEVRPKEMATVIRLFSSSSLIHSKES